MAERIVDMVVKDLYKAEGKPIEACYTDDMVLSGGHFKSPGQVIKYGPQLALKHAHLGCTAEQIQRLVEKYGTNTEIILHLYEVQLYRWANHSIGERLLLAELHYGVRYEGVQTLSDFLIRRRAACTLSAKAWMCFARCC